MNTDIGKINSIEKGNKVSTIKWRPIYEVIEKAYFKESNIFSNDL